jgi:putative membrane-bound dehydrogenase-like protein
MIDVRWFGLCSQFAVLAVWLYVPPAFAAERDFKLPPIPARTPREEAATFHLPKGFRVELVAAEPEVVDPVAIAFDEEGRLFVAEMRGYPNGGVATGNITSGRVKLLEDRDGDGFYEHSTIFAEHLRFPAAVMPWKGGLLVADPPDILFLVDTDHDGRADRLRKLYTGFALDNVEQIINGLQWGLDNWVYGVAGGNGGTIQSTERPDRAPVTLRGRGVRFHPEAPGSLEEMSGGGQYGLAADDWQQWFTATNSQHLRHIILPDHYLRRNPSLPVSAVTLDIPDHGAACKVFRISPFEPWRVERTRRRAKGPDAQRFPSTELVPGGFITSGCSPVVYTADLFPLEFHGNTLVCDPANNLIHRDILKQHGATFIAERAYPDREFLASTDNWFRPVFLTIGPDGAIYVADFYREVIETPLSLPDDIKKAVNLESRGRGRIWRIVPEGRPLKRARPALRSASAEELAHHVADQNPWWRFTAQRLLVERQDKAAVKPLETVARSAQHAPGRAQALWTLRGLKALDDALIIAALKDSEAGVREQALRLAEEHLPTSAALRSAVALLADDPSPRVRFQLAFSLGEAEGPEVISTLAKVARRDANDPWTQIAILSSAARTAPGLLDTLVHDKDFTVHPTAAHLSLLTRLAALVGARSSETDLGRALRLLDAAKDSDANWQVAILGGLGQGMQNSRYPLTRLWDQPPPALKSSVDHARAFFTRAAATAQDDKRSVAERLGAIRLLGYGPFASAQGLTALLGPQNASELQMAAVRTLALHDNSKVASILLSGWNTHSPALRREVLESLFARSDRLISLLDAIQDQRVSASQMEPFRLELLRKHSNATIRARAQKLLAGQATSDRRRILEDYKNALDLKADSARGKMVFQKTCATCHRLENVGVEVGPDLLSALRTKTREGLLTDILDPSLEVDPRFINYIVMTKAGRVLTGMIATETASSITLRRAEKAEDTVLRNQIDEVQATAKSLMPEGLEMQLTRQDVADVIAYLLSVGGAR